MPADSETVQRAERRLGTVLRGKYRLDRVLGVGGMAIVYAATHRNQKQFAVKVLHPELSLNADLRGRFLREGYAANSVKHAGALAVLDDDTAEDGAAFLVMELLEGASVEELWEQNNSQLPLAPVLGMAHQALDVLAAAHANGIVHRDIKPANLFLTYDGVVKVLDFGIARVRDAAASNAQATGAGILLGTPAFMAPEQALGRASELDSRTDLWAMGATLFTLLSGRPVHTGETGSEVLIRAATTAAQSLADVAPGTPASVVGLIDRALSYEKGKRWPGAEAMRDAVAHAQVTVFGQRVSTEVLSSLCRGLGRTFSLTQGMRNARPALSGSPPPPTTPPLAFAPEAPVAPTVDDLRRSPIAARQLDPSGIADGQGDRQSIETRGVAPTVEWLDVAGAPSSPSGTTVRTVFTDEPLVPAGLPDHRPLVIAAAFVGAALVAGAAAFGVHSMTSALSASTSASVEPGATSTAAGAHPGSTGSAALSGAAAASDRMVPAQGSPAASSVPSATTRAASSQWNAGPPAEVPVASSSPAHSGASAPPGLTTPPSLASPSTPAIPSTPTTPPTPSTPATLTTPSRPTAPSTPTMPGPASNPPAAPPNCKPPFYFDAAGNKVFKKECL